MWVNRASLRHSRPAGAIHPDWMMWRREAATTIDLDERDRRVASVAPFHDPSRRSRLVKVGGWLVGDRARRRRPEPARRRRRRLAPGPLERDQGHSARLPDRGAHTSERARRSLPGSPTTASCAPRIPGRSSSGRSSTAYAVGVAMNNFLPANIGTFATLVMFYRHHPGLHVSRGARRLPGPEDLLHGRRARSSTSTSSCPCPAPSTESLGNVSEDPLRTILIAAGAVFLIVILAKLFWKQLKKLWAEGEARWRDPRPPEGVLHAFVPCRRSSPGSASSA